MGPVRLDSVTWHLAEYHHASVQNWVTWAAQLVAFPRHIGCWKERQCKWRGVRRNITSVSFIACSLHPCFLLLEAFK